MKNITSTLCLCFSLLLVATFSWAQSLQSPSDFLGYELGSQFTYVHRVNDYMRHAANASPKMMVEPYGESVEGRELILCILSSEENLKNIDQIKKNNRILTGLEQGTVQGKTLPIVWLSYNIHGNESVSSEAAMATVYSLLTNEFPNSADWLNEVVVVIDPCENPDGRARYVNWYKQKTGTIQNPNQDDWEHNEPWPGGRFNHYLFDLNRDWAWQTQQETRARIAAYQQWMPHVHVDLHEMGVNAPYFFGPSAEPFHEVITPWQREFHRLSGQNNAKYFDKQGWRYFTRETFDLFYPSYGDTWPTYNGAIGFTFEQGGSGRAGLGIYTETGQVLTLKDRLDHHHHASISTVDAAYQQRERLVSEFKKYFGEVANNPVGTYKSYVIRHTNDPDKVKALLKLLDGQQIRYGYAEMGGKARTVTGFQYATQKDASFALDQKDIVVSAAQPMSRMVKVLLEPSSRYTDSVTYDLTSWAMPYAYNLDAYAVKELLGVSKQAVTFETASAPAKAPVYGYIAEWKDVADAKLLSSLLVRGLNVRFAEEPFTAEGKNFDRGTLLILAGDNTDAGEQFAELVSEAVAETGQQVTVAQSGLVAAGKDFGSSAFRFIGQPQVALLAGEGVSPTAFGELWYYFQEELKYPVTVINTDDLSNVDLDRYDVMVLATGNYRSQSETLMEYVQQGGKVIAIERAMGIFGKEKTALSRAVGDQKKPETAKGEALLKKYGDRERESLTESTEGSVYKVYLDETHPLAYGNGAQMFLMKRNSETYPYLGEGGWNVGVFKADSHLAGFAGYRFKEKAKNTLAIGAESVGEGTVVYFTDSPVIRAFWHSGKITLANAVFFAGR